MRNYFIMNKNHKWGFVGILSFLYVGYFFYTTINSFSTLDDLNAPIIASVDLNNGNKTEMSDVNDSSYKARVLMGIFCRRNQDEAAKEKFRKLFSLDSRVCTLGQYERYVLEKKKNNCQFIYTFVTGACECPNAPTRLVDDRFPILVGDEEEIDDEINMNVKENMNEGKSETWFYFASLIIDKLGIDYVGKMDIDTVPYLDMYFNFAGNNLPPSPFNRRTIIGLMADKLWWPWKRYKEIFFKNYYPGYDHNMRKFVGFHVYPMGQLYILSRDLVHGVAKVAKDPSYNFQAGIEDHDIGAMAYMAADGEPIKLLSLSLLSKFWRHGIKLLEGKEQEWNEVWVNETNRIASHDFRNPNDGLFEDRR